MRRPTPRQVLALMGGLIALPIACSKVLGIEPAHERADGDGGTAIIDSTAPLEDGALPPLGDKDASCGDTTSDSKNCGACGNDCQGTKCTNGRCEPSVFVFGLLRPSHLAVTDEGIYWVDGLTSGPGAGVRRCDLTGCQNGMPRTVFERENGIYSAIAVEGDNVFVLRAGTSTFRGIDVCNRLGCSNSPYVIDVPATSFANVGQKLHYAMQPIPSASVGTPDGGIWRCDGLPYCYPKTYVSPHTPAVVRGTDADLYVLDKPLTAGNGTLLRCVGGNCTSPKTLASGLSNAWRGFVASKYGVGWIAHNGPDIKLFLCEAQSCAGGPKTLASLGGYMESFAFDSKFLYWANSEYSTIERVAWTATNAKPEIVLTKQGIPMGIAMRDGALYFTRFDFGDIVRWVPPP